MTAYLTIAGLFVSCEIVLYIVAFRFLGRLYLEDDKTTKSNVEFGDFFKGLFERLVLAIALTNSIPQILIFFGAMKVATRLKTETETDDYNDFFLIGNLLSVFMALQYSSFLLPNSYLVKTVLSWINTEFAQWFLC